MGDDDLVDVGHCYLHVTATQVPSDLQVTQRYAVFSRRERQYRRPVGHFSQMGNLVELAAKES